MKKINDHFKLVKRFLVSEFKKSPISFIILGVIFSVALFLRTYRLNDLLGFYFDQGRDALVIWKFWHEGKLFLIGPVTGLEGIFLGPFYYYLIAPIYLIGAGNPVFPAVFLASLSAIAVVAAYVLGLNMHSKTAGLTAAFISGISFYIIYNSRWLSNPNPMLLLSTLFLGSLWLIVSSKNSRWFIAAFLIAGVSLHFESASAVFYLPILLAIFIWHYRLYKLKSYKSLLGKKNELRIVLISAGLLFMTFLPQLIFNFRHENILFNNFMKLFVHERSFKPLTMYLFEKKIDYFWNTFTNKIYPGHVPYEPLLLAVPFAALYVNRRNLKKGLLQLFLIFFAIPIIAYTFYQGNHGNLYDYYMMGYFMPFILLVSIGLAEFSRTWIGKGFLVVFLASVLANNAPPMESILKNKMDGPTNIKLGSQISAVDWIISDAVGRGKFNLHVYVPPVIPHAYDYLYLWQANKICGENMCGKASEEVPLIYTLFEQDPPHPERLEKWMTDQGNIGIVKEEVRFGGITVQRRERHNF